MSPVFAHGHLRLYLLSLLAERPMHGYEIIQALSDRFGGTYIPSAGTIYPRLSKLGEEGLVTREADGRKTVYSITEAGRAELADRQGELDEIEDGVTETVRSLADEVRSTVNEAMRTIRADLASAAREAGATATENAREADIHTVDNRMRLHDAEMVLADFSRTMRATLRERSAAGELGDDTAAWLRGRLDEVLETMP